MKIKTLEKTKRFLSFSLVLVIVFTIGLKLIEPAFAQNTQTQQNQTQQNQTDSENTNVLTPTSTVNTDTSYLPLAPLPGLGDQGERYETVGSCPFGKYLNIMIKLIIGISTVLAMVMIVLGGMEYMTSELISSKEAGKEKVRNAILGLLLALGAYLILYTINPTLLNVCLGDIPKANIFIDSETIEETIGTSGSIGKKITVNGQTVTACNPSEIRTISFLGKQVQVNQAIVADLQAINTEWANSTDPRIRNYRIDTIYGYVCKHVKNQPGKVSAHSFGIALDINPSRNPFSYTRCITDMPQPAFVQMFKSRGFGWGGNWNSLKDAMHFSKLPNEIGSSGSCS